MAVRISRATGNWLTAGTWGLVDATSYNNSETTTTALTTSYQASSGSTTGVITTDGVALKLSVRTGTTGTMSVHLAIAGVEVTGTLVTINVADLPAAATATLDGGWIFFKFAASVALLGATSYTVEAKTSSSSQVSLFSSSGTNWSRAISTTATGAPAAGDDVIVCGEYTGAGTSNSFTVTMDETAATDYGSNTTSAVTPALAICSKGTLSFKSTSAANPYLRLSGYAVGYNGGTLNVGTTGTPIPRDSVGILEFDCAADGDFGLVTRNGSTCNLQGLSRTSAKNVVSAKLNANSSTNTVQAIALTASALTAAAVTTTLDPTGTTLGSGITAGTFNQLIGSTDTAGNANHKYTWTGASVTNVTQVFTIWVKRGSGTNNRYIRLQLATATALPATNGFYADFDLSAVTAGTCTALGNGTATSSAITAFGGGYICTIIGKVSSGAGSSIACIGACNSSGGVSYAGDATQNFICTWPQVYTASAQPTDLTVDTDTGWLSGDVVAIASTTRTANECEIVSLNGNAGATTLTCNLYPVNYHDGASPVQAEVILLTRNVKVRSVSTTAMSFVNVQDGSAVDIDWTEFYYMGQNSSTKRGIEISIPGSNAINFSMQFSSVHDTEVGGFYSAVTSQTITSMVFSSNDMWNCATTTGPAGNISVAITATNYTIDSNILIRTGNGNGWTLSDVGGTFTNNTVVGAASVGIALSEAAIIGTMSGNVGHSNVSSGVSFGSAGIGGTFGSPTAWRNSGVGFNFTNSSIDLVLDTPTAFGNLTSNISFSISIDVWIKSATLNGDTTFATVNGVAANAVGIVPVCLIDNSDFSTVTGIKTAHTNDINISSASVDARIVLRNTKLGAATQVATPSNLSNNGYIEAEKLGQTAGNHVTWMRNGKVQTDASVFNTAAPSQLMTPTSATLKLESAAQFQGIKIPVANGGSVTATVFIRKSASYNGNQPRLIVRANPAIGIAADAVLATYSGGTGSWASISGATAAVTDDGEVELVVDCDGTAGAINVDDWSTTGGAQDNGALGYWFNGLPAQGIVPTSTSRMLVNPGMQGGARG